MSVNFKPGCYFQHRHGGIYYALDSAIHTETKEELAVYRHIYPFHEQLYVRPIKQFTEERFTVLDEELLEKLLAVDKQQLQKSISDRKALS